MLAHTWESHGARMAFPAFAQPKLDGMRLMYDAARYAATSRTGKRVDEVRTILDELARGKWEGAVLDGELYAHGLNFQNVMRAVHADAPSLRYHVYDLVSEEPFEARAARLAGLAARNRGLTHVVFVGTTRVATRADVTPALDAAVRDGYEGLMVRAAAAPYTGKRSAALLKLKRFQDAEFSVVGFKASAVGCVVWECETMAGGPRFSVKPRGTNAEAAAELAAAALRIGSRLTVQYQGLSDGGVPRFPTGVGFRDARDLPPPPPPPPTLPKHAQAREPKVAAAVQACRETTAEPPMDAPPKRKRAPTRVTVVRPPAKPLT